MTKQKANQVTVRRGLLEGKKTPDSLSAVDLVCTAGMQCQEVQSSPVAMAALNMLQATVVTAHGSQQNKQLLAQALMAAIKTLEGDVIAMKAALAVYQTAVDAIADGDAAVINKAGLASRAQKLAAPELERVTTVTSAPGKSKSWAMITWSRAAGASVYAMEVNFTPQTPDGPWVAVTPGSRHSRAVKGPGPGAQFLVRIAALGSGGEQSDWSDPILATAL